MRRQDMYVVFQYNYKLVSVRFRLKCYAMQLANIERFINTHRLGPEYVAIIKA